LTHERNPILPMKCGAGGRALAAAALFVLGSTPALGLTDEEIFRGFRFNFINPGARSLALGGAFISLADDATSAQANPAGLSILLRPEYFFEARGVDDGGETTLVRQNLPTGISSAVGSGTNLADAQRITFASAVIPIQRVTLGFSRQEVLNSESRTLNQFGLSFTSPSGVFSASGSGFNNVHLADYNASAGVRLSDRFALGASASLAVLRVDSEVDNFVVDTDGVVAPNPIPQPTLDLRTRISDSDSALGFNLGTIVRVSDAVSVGAVYRHAPRLSVSEHVLPGTDLFGVHARLGSRFTNVFDIPDSYGIGASWRLQQNLTLALDVDRVRFSDLLNGYVPGVNVLTGPNARFTVDDATDVRVGGEWVHLTHGGVPLAFRGGIYTQPDSTIRALSVGRKSLPSGGSVPFGTNASFPGGDDEIHGAAGLGIVKGRVKVDLGMDLGRVSNQFLVSVIVQGD
jgi:long-chain fatty acid transport protein